MAKLGLASLVLLAATCFVITSTAARWNDKPNSGICKSGMRTTDLKFCKENGGKR